MFVRLVDHWATDIGSRSSCSLKQTERGSPAEASSACMVTALQNTDMNFAMTLLPCARAQWVKHSVLSSSKNRQILRSRGLSEWLTLSGCLKCRKVTIVFTCHHERYKSCYLIGHVYRPHLVSTAMCCFDCACLSSILLMIVKSSYRPFPQPGSLHAGVRFYIRDDIIEKSSY